MKPVVSIGSCPGYNADEVYKTISVCADASGFPDISGKKVLLKPNILSDSPASLAVTTHPVFLSQVIRFCRDKGAQEVFVGDSAPNNQQSIKAQKCGLRKASETCGAIWVDFSETSSVIKINQGKVLKEAAISGIYNNVDTVISLPKLKTHMLMSFTGAMKNLFGFVTGFDKPKYHIRYLGVQKLASALVDLYLRLDKCEFAFMDGIIAMEGPGPGSGFPRSLGVVISGSELAAVDTVAGYIIGYSPEMMPMVSEALSRTQWYNGNAINDIEVKGENPANVRVDDFQLVKSTKKGIRSFFSNVIYRIFSNTSMPKPSIISKVCVKCGECVKICPAETISFEKDEIKLNEKACISCYCCHEVCPAKAIVIPDRA